MLLYITLIRAYTSCIKNHGCTSMCKLIAYSSSYSLGDFIRQVLLEKFPVDENTLCSFRYKNGARCLSYSTKGHLFNSLQ